MQSHTVSVSIWIKKGVLRTLFSLDFINSIHVHRILRQPKTDAHTKSQNHSKTRNVTNFSPSETE